MAGHSMAKRLTWVGLGTVLTVAIGSAPAIGQTHLAQSGEEMFSPEIQSILETCQSQGGVDLAAGAASGAIVCGDGSPNSEIAYADYLNTMADILSASWLLGARDYVVSDPSVTPEVLATVLTDPQNVDTMREGLQQTIAGNGSPIANSEGSVPLLTDAVMDRVLPVLQQNELEGLLGTPEQYEQVVSSFCTAPGMSVEQAQQTVPALSSVQLYAICIQESGVVKGVTETPPS